LSEDPWEIVHGKPGPVEVLAFGPHPDDIEVGATGLLLNCVDRGMKVGLVDLTRGELGTKGTAEVRIAESREAARRIGATFRVNLGLPDGSVRDDDPSRDKALRILRVGRPDWVLSNIEDELHPDHAAGARLVKAAFFLSRLPKRLPEVPAHSPRNLFFYLIHTRSEPVFLCDISACFERKFEVMAAYEKQFVTPEVPEGYRYAGLSDYLRDVRALGESWGATVGVEAAEAFAAHKPPVIRDLAVLT
jgi:bacillithiol biosynthesis deacetylase BshB1